MSRNPYNIDALLSGMDDLDVDDDEQEEENRTIMTKDSLEKKKQVGRTLSGSSKGSRKGTKKSSSPLKKNSGGGGLSLGAALQKVAGPTLERKDFGRGMDDNDTFCGLGTVGEKELKKAPISKQTKPASPKKVKTQQRSNVGPPQPIVKKAAAVPPPPNPFGNFGNNNDSDDDDDEDFCFDNFKNTNNPFKMPSYFG